MICDPAHDLGRDRLRGGTGMHVLKGFVRLVVLAATGLALVVGVAPLSAASAQTGSAQSAPTQVTTDKGAVVGVVDGDVRSFFGVPYAAPPTGDGRWAAPKPAAKWSTPMQTTTPGNACEQNVNTRYANSSVGVSEDCLFLNVQTPAAKASKL